MTSQWTGQGQSSSRGRKRAHSTTLGTGTGNPPVTKSLAVHQRSLLWAAEATITGDASSVLHAVGERNPAFDSSPTARIAVAGVRSFPPRGRADGTIGRQASRPASPPPPDGSSVDPQRTRSIPRRRQASPARAPAPRTPRAPRACACAAPSSASTRSSPRCPGPWASSTARAPAAGPRGGFEGAHRRRARQRGRRAPLHPEAQSLARLRHPRIVPIHDIGEVAGRHYFSMTSSTGSP